MGENQVTLAKKPCKNTPLKHYKALDYNDKVYLAFWFMFLTINSPLNRLTDSCGSNVRSATASKKDEKII